MKLLAILCLLFSNLLFAQKSKHIGFLMDDLYSERWKKDSAEFALNVRRLGHRITIRVCESDTALQHKQANELMDLGVSILVIVPEDGKSSSVIVQDAHKRNVTVIAYDRLILNADLDYYISFDAFEIGKLQAQFIVDSLKGKGNVILLNGPVSDQNANLFREGQLNVLKPFVESGKIKILHDIRVLDWVILAATMEINEFLLTTKEPVNAVIAATDELAEGALEAFLFSKPKERLLVTGQNADPLGLDRIRNGTQGMTIFKNVEELAKRAAILATDMALKKDIASTSSIYNGKKQVPFQKLVPVVITQKNINSVF